MDPLERTLRAEVAERFRVTGADTPGWPDPHRGALPADDEYSRLLDPGKYRILDARARAWVEVLVDRGAATAQPAAPVPVVGRATAPPEEATWVRPVVAGALPLLIGLRSIQDVPRTFLEIAVGADPVSVLALPGCGCDACDDGSDGLLQMLDDQLAEIVLGRFVGVVRASWTMFTTTDGAEGHGDLPPDGFELADRVRAGGPPYDALHGPGWVT